MKLLSLGKVLALMTAIALPGSVLAQSGDFPSQPIRIVNPFAAGGVGDVTVRSLTATASEFVEQPILIENVTGAGGVTGMLQVMNAAPDGHTVLLSDSVIVTLPLFQAGVPVTRENFKPIGIFNVRGAWLLTRPGKGWKTVEDFVAAARERPGELTVGVPSKGSPQELAVVALEDAFDISLNIIPYTGGAPTMAALLGDQIDAAMTGSPAGLDSVLAGEAVFLVASTELEIEKFPGEITSFADAKVPHDLGIWMALWTPKDTPDETVAALADMFGKMAAHPKWLEFARNYGVTPVWMGPEEATSYIEQSAQTHAELAKLLESR